MPLIAGFAYLSNAGPKITADDWAINLAVLCLIVASYMAYRENEYGLKNVAILVVVMAITAFYGVLKLRRMQMIYDAKCPAKGQQLGRKGLVMCWHN
jgi:hypothetical protein